MKWIGWGVKDCACANAGVDFFTLSEVLSGLLLGGHLLNLRAMLTADKSELLIGVLAVAAMAILSLWRLLLWVKSAPVHPDPWDETTEVAVQQDDAVPVCHHCLSEVPPGQWFCEHCGCAVGPYNNWMPFIYVFSEGEVLRNGIFNRVRVGFLTITGYTFLCASFFFVIFFAMRSPGQLLAVFLFVVFLAALVAYVVQLARNFRRCQKGKIGDESSSGDAQSQNAG